MKSTKNCKFVIFKFILYLQNRYNYSYIVRFGPWKIYSGKSFEKIYAPFKDP